MSETAAQYRDRLLRTLGSNQPLEVLGQTPALLRDWMEVIGREKWQASHAADQWSPAQVLSHLAEGEMVFAFRIRMIARTSGVPIPAYDQNIWVNNSGYLTADPSLALKVFETLRQANLSYIHSIPKTDYENYGIHAERGKETVHDLLRLVAGHDLNHLKQIEERLR